MESAVWVTGLLVIGAALWWYMKPDQKGKHVANRDSKNEAMRSSIKAPQKVVKQEVVKEKSGLPLKILFGSQTGTAEDFARKLATEAKKYTFDPEVVDLEEFDAHSLPDEKFVIFVVATYGEGEPTDNAREFFEHIKDGSHAADLLSGIEYTVFGLGNKTYEHYNEMARFFDKRMEELGARRVFKRGEGDDDASLEDDFAAWKKELWPSICQHFGIQMTNIVSDEVERRFRIEFYQPGAKEIFISQKNAGKHLSKKSFSEKIYDIKNPYLATVAVNKELHTSLSDRSCRHIEIEVGDELRYEAGDHIGVYPENNDEIVQAVATRLGVQLDSVFSLFNLEGKTRTPVVGPTTVRQALKQWCELTNQPRKSLLRLFAHYAKDSNEKTTLLNLSDDSKHQPYTSYIKDDQRSVAEILLEFPSVAIPFDHFVEAVPRLAPRYYSISSSLKGAPGFVHVTSVVVNFTTATGRKHRGVCSNWLTQQIPVEGQSPPLVPVFIQKANFHLPRDPSVPVVMVGPGTGLAPFRGFIQERRAQFKNGISSENVLFFGCRAPNVDFIYHDELVEAQQEGILKLFVAFSRENPEKKVYVQHIMQEHKQMLWNLLHDRKGVFYICGDARHMAKDVHQVLHNIVVELGGKSDAEAEAYLADMEKTGRYLSDTWF